MVDRGPASYIAEFVGTFLLVLFITSVVTLYVATGQAAAQFGSDFAVVGLAHALILAILVQMFGAVSGAHFNPAVTLAALLLRKIKGIDALIYMLLQLTGGVAGALVTREFLKDEGRAANYGAAEVGQFLANNFQGMLVEAIGTFVLVFTIICIALNPRARSEFAPITIGFALGAIVMVFGPLTGAAVNPARWFGPALVSSEFGAVWPYLVGALLGSLAAAGLYRYVIEPGEEAMGRPSPEAPGKRL